MKIVVKTLKGTRFEIQVNPDDSVADVKKNIETVLGASEYPAAEQTLIHKGKILKDETTMEANNVAEKSCIAIMKRKPAPTGSSTAPTGSVTASVGRSAQGIQEQTQEAAAPEAAERKGFYYFPEGLPNDGSLEFLRHTQQLPVLRSLVRSDPDLLPEILEVIEKKNAPLFKMIRENEAGFLSLLNDEGGPDHEEDEFFNHIPPEQYESIQRLEAMGFEEDLVLEVYLACNKNEELAASFLLDHCH